MAAESMAQWYRTLGPLMDRLGGKGLVAELGSGAGDTSLSIAALGWWVVGFELSPVAVNWATAKAEAKAAGAEFLCRDLGEPLEPLNSYLGACDLVIDGDCFHYLLGPRRKIFLENARALLSPAGYFVVRTVIGQPGEENQERLGYVPEGRYISVDGVPMTYFAELEEVLEELKAADLVIESYDIRRVDPRKGSDILTAVCRLKT
jgi:SAM-dependent methyltransferase